MAKFLLLTHIYPPAIDGGSKVIAKMAVYFKNHGHQVKIITTNAQSTDDFTHPHRSIYKSSSDVFRLPVYTFFHKPLKLFSKVLSKGPIFKLLPFFQTILSVLRYHPDFIIAGPLPTTIVLYARLFRLLTGAKLIINASFHYTDPEFHQSILINTLQSTDFIWTLTDFETNYFHNNFHIPYSKLINIGNGIDPTLLVKNSKLKTKNFPNLLFIGSFAAHKGLETLFAAYKLLPKNFTLTIAGKFTLHQLDIPPNVKVITNFPDSKLTSIIDSCSILISPSTQESFGLVLLEAMARGKPVIAASIPASTELIQKSQSGLIFKTNDPIDLADKIVRLYNSPSLIKRFSRNGLVYAQDHTWDKIGESLWQKISSLSS